MPEIVRVAKNIKAFFEEALCQLVGVPGHYIRLVRLAPHQPCDIKDSESTVVSWNKTFAHAVYTAVNGNAIALFRRYLLETAYSNSSLWRKFSELFPFKLAWNKARRVERNHPIGVSSLNAAA